MKWKNADFKILLWPLVVVVAGVSLYLLTPKIIELLGFITGMLLPFIIGYVLSRAINPLADILQKQFKFPRGLTVILVIVVVIGVLAALAYWGASSLSDKFAGIFSEEHDLKGAFMDSYALAIEKLTILYNSLPEVIQDAILSIADNSGAATELVMDYAARFVKAMPNFFVALIVGILSLYFMVSDSTSLSSILKIQSTKSADVWLQIKKYLGGYVKAQLIIMSVTATVMLVWFLILDVKYAILVAIGIAFLDALPIFGSGLVLWPWSLMNFLNGDIRMGIFTILIYLSIALTRHLIEPKLVSTNVGMNPLLTLMSMYIGYRVLSVGGLILGPLTMLLIMSLYKAGVFDTAIAIVKQVLKKTGNTLNAVKEYLLSDDE